ncbi:MAG: class I SAM-dependent methyltransferase [Thaumarchaeota archaeon]|nr:class I SAM-dependent methyltransferase [Nitrososphaerota archaeon]
MRLKDTKKNWNEFADSDPKSAILTEKGNWNQKEFFETGSKEISELLEKTKQIQFERGRALDFGCGIGRLSRALASHFEEVVGVDISERMIDLAKQYNSDRKNCKFYLNETEDLKAFNDNYFDLIYSARTLQHIDPEYSKNYIKEFLRILSPEGVLVFQLPSERQGVKRFMQKGIHATNTVRTKINSGPVMEMYGIKQNEVKALILKAKGKPIKVESSGNAPGWTDFLYYVTK